MKKFSLDEMEQVSGDGNYSDKHDAAQVSSAGNIGCSIPGKYPNPVVPA